MDTLNDTKIKLTNEEIEIGGMINPPNSAPGNDQAEIVTPDTNTVRRYRTITLMPHDKRPNVSKLIGINKIRSSGATRSIRRLNTKPANNNDCHPPEISSAENVCETSHKANVWKRNTRSKYFIDSLWYQVIT